MADRALPDPRRPIPAPHHHPDQPTAVSAAQLITPRAGSLRALALNAIAAAEPDGLTDVELAAATGVYLYSIAPRRTELLHAGWLDDSGRRRPTPQRRPAIVWVLSDDARSLLNSTPTTATESETRHP